MLCSCVHYIMYCCIYMHCSLKALDVVALRELSKRVNVLPIIAKADTTSKDELQRFKAKVGCCVTYIVYMLP